MQTRRASRRRIHTRRVFHASQLTPMALSNTVTRLSVITTQAGGALAVTPGVLFLRVETAAIIKARGMGAFNSSWNGKGNWFGKVQSPSAGHLSTLCWMQPPLMSTPVLLSIPLREIAPFPHKPPPECGECAGLDLSIIHWPSRPRQRRCPRCEPMTPARSPASRPGLIVPAQIAAEVQWLFDNRPWLRLPSRFD